MAPPPPIMGPRPALLAPPPPIMGPRPALLPVPVLPRVGFDILAENIHTVHRSVQPGHKTTGGAVLAVGRTIKSAFTEGSGKRASEVKANNDDSVVPAKRRSLPSVTPSVSSVSTSIVTRSLPSRTPSRTSNAATSHATSASDDQNYFSYLPSEGFVPGHGHPSQRPSVVQPVYRRLPPEDIVRLTSGDELIIVVPTVTTTKKGDAYATFARVLEFYKNAFATAARKRKTLSRMEPSTSSVEEIILGRHRFRREDKWFFEYPVRVQNYAERDNFSRTYINRGPVDYSWSQGAWINLSFCGYSLKDTILLQLRHVGFLEVYKRTNHHQFLNDYICFNGNGRCEENFGGPLIRQLALFHGCRFETMEVMWKYYRALYCCGHRRMARKETAYKKLLAARLADADRAEADRRCR
jgi:hypothetical protein